MHTRLHYAVIEITIDTQTINIFDGLYRSLLDWKDHVIRAIRKCMLVDPFVVPSSAQFNADAAVYEIVGCSRKPQEFVNGMTSSLPCRSGNYSKATFSTNWMEITVDQSHV